MILTYRLDQHSNHGREDIEKIHTSQRVVDNGKCQSELSTKTLAHGQQHKVHHPGTKPSLICLKPEDHA